MLRQVKTENGWVKGIEAADPRITAFKGIPFAAPPVGENRWRAPQPCENWGGVKEAYRFAPIAVQDTPGVGDDIYCREWHVDPDIAMDEDCLYLNVWTPAKSAEEKMPVLVWFYGGGLQWGYPAEMEFDGERLARRGIVVVTVNYRINVFGFLAHPQITREQPDAPGNCGSLDQQAGLKWVARNIAAFGGDPGNITIAGQSAGGGSVMSQMACMDNQGLFQRAVVMSAMIRNPYGEEAVGKPEPLEQAEKNGEDFFAFLGVKTLEEARALDAFYIRDKYGEYAQKHPRLFTVLDHRLVLRGRSAQTDQRRKMCGCAHDGRQYRGRVPELPFGGFFRSACAAGGGTVRQQGGGISGVSGDTAGRRKRALRRGQRHRVHGQEPFCRKKQEREQEQLLLLPL